VKYRKIVWEILTCPAFWASDTKVSPDFSSVKRSVTTGVSLSGGYFNHSWWISAD